MTMVFVTFPGDTASKFDREYYYNTHLPLVRNCYEKYGLESVGGFFPEREAGGLFLVAALTFKDDASMKTALASPEAQQVMDDVANFTDVQPSQFIGKST